MICEKCACNMVYYGIDVILHKYAIYQCTNCTYVVAKEVTCVVEEKNYE